MVAEAAVETQTAETEEQIPSMEDALNGALDSLDGGEPGSDAGAEAGQEPAAGAEAGSEGSDDEAGAEAGSEASGDGRERDEHGRFKVKEGSAEGTEAAGTDEPPAGEAEQTAETTSESQLVDGRDITKAPTSWKAEASAEFDKLPEPVRREIHRREEDIHRGIEQYKGAAQFGSSLAKVIEPHRETLEKLQVAPTVLMDAALKFETSMQGSNEEKLDMFRRLAQAYGVELKDGEIQLSEQENGADPRYSALEQKITGLESKLTEREQAEQRREEQRQREAIRSEISEFRQDPKNGLYDVVKDQMARLLSDQDSGVQTLRQAYDVSVLQNPTALERLKTDMEFIGQVKDDVLQIVTSGQGADLKSAYDKAVWINPATRAKLIARQQEGERKSAAERAAAAKKHDQINVTSRATPSDKTSGKGTTDEALNAALDEVMG